MEEIGPEQIEAIPQIQTVVQVESPTIRQQQHGAQSLTPLAQVRKGYSGAKPHSAAPTLRTSGRHHKSYTVGFKLQVLDWYHANGENKYQTSTRFGLDRKRIRDWLDNEERFRTEPLTNRRKRSNAPGCPPYYKNLDDALDEWYTEQKAQGILVSTRDLRTKALELAPQLGIESFKASQSYITSWKRRTGNEEGHPHNCGRDEQEQPLPNNNMLPSEFEEHLRQLERAGVDLSCNDSMEDLASSVAGAMDYSSSRERLHVSGSAGDIQAGAGQSTTQQVNLGQRPTRVTSTPLVQTPATGGGGGGVEGTMIEKLGEHEQWISIVQQTVESLESDITSKIAQMKLVLQQLKTSVCQTRAQLEESGQSAGSKRANTDGSVMPQPRKVRKI